MSAVSLALQIGVTAAAAASVMIAVVYWVGRSPSLAVIMVSAAFQVAVAVAAWLHPALIVLWVILVTAAATLSIRSARRGRRS